MQISYYYKMSIKKSKLIEGIAKAGIKVGIIGGLYMLPASLNGQDNYAIQKGVNAGNYESERETPTHFVYKFKFNEDLKKAIRDSKEPQLYTTDSNSYIKFNSDTSAFELYYFKKNFDESGVGKSIGLTVREKGKVGVCDTTGLGSKGSFLPSFFWKPANLNSEQPEKVIIEQIGDTIPKGLSQAKPTINYDIDINNTTNNITNNYYNLLDTLRNKPKLSDLEFRILVEGNKALNNPLGGISAILQLGKGAEKDAEKGAIWAGIYGTLGFGKERTSSSTDVNATTLLNQAIQLYTETKGIRKESSKLAYPIDFGGILSFNTKDNRVRLNLGYGFANEVVSKSGISESGTDLVRQGNNVIQVKPYSFELEKGRIDKTLVSSKKIEIDFKPSKKLGAYVGFEAQQRGDLKKGNLNFNAKAGYMFGNSGKGVRGKK